MPASGWTKTLVSFSMLIALAALANCSRAQFTEVEPNDTPRQATQITVNATVRGVIGTAGDTDFFAFAIARPTVLDIRLSAAEGIDHGFTIGAIDHAGFTPLKTVDDGRHGAPERMCNFHAAPGGYAVMVRHRDAIGAATRGRPYHLVIDGRPARPNEEREPNDAPSAANPIVVGQEMRGYFSPGRNPENRRPTAEFREEDWYSIDVPADGASEASLIDITLVGSPSINALVCLHNRSGAVLGCADKNGVGGDESLMGAPLDSTGRYYIMVAALDNAANGNIPYLLTVRVRPRSR